MQEIISNMMVWHPSYSWVLLEIFLISLLYIGYKFFNKSWIMIMFGLAFEWAYKFFEDILWKEEKSWIKMYIVLMFFIILFSNILGLLLDFGLPIFWEEAIAANIMIPTAEINFNIAMAIIWVIIIILEQFKTLGFWKTIHEYVPIKWKNLIPYERWSLPGAVDWFVFILVKFFDIVISLFLWILDIVGHLAKIISLSFRLFWNMISGSMLLVMLFWAISGLTIAVTGIDFPIIGPIILYLQGLLVAVIQALVFPLLIAIFIKVAKVEE